MDILTLSGVKTPAPTDYEVVYSDLDSDDTTRTETGMLQRTRVREGIAKIAVSWEKITADEAIAIINAVKPEKFNVQYFFGGIQSAQMYAGDRKLDLAYIDSNQQSFWDLSMSLIEY